MVSILDHLKAIVTPVNELCNKNDFDNPDWAKPEADMTAICHTMPFGPGPWRKVTKQYPSILKLIYSSVR